MQKVSKKAGLLALLIVVFNNVVISQSPFPQQGMEITGRVVVESPRGIQPVPFSSVVMRALRDSTKMEGTFCDENGVYSLAKLYPGKWQRSVSAVGFQTVIDTVMLPPMPQQKLPDIVLVSSARTLDAFSVEEEKEEFRMEVDRKVFNVDKNLVSMGGSALDALRQVPLLNVDTDGTITLRGSGNFLVYINGKPSGFTVENRSQILEQIPASNIERVELITSPSARYEAEGMAGILNIVTKQEREAGSFGSLQAGLGWPFTANTAISWTRNSSKWNITNTLSHRSTHRIFRFRHDRELFIDGVPGLNQEIFGDVDRYDHGGTWSGGVDFNANKNNSLQFTYLGSIRYNENIEVNHYRFANEFMTPTRNFFREADNYENGANADLGLNWTRKDKKENPGEFSMAASFSFNQNYERGGFLQLDSFPVSLRSGSRTNLDRSNMVAAVQADRIQPLGNKHKIEFGVRSQMRMLSSVLEADSLNTAGDFWYTDTLLTNDFKYTEYVQAAYIQAGGKLSSKLEYQAGIRLEHTLALGQARSQNVFEKPYLNPFPTLQLKYSPAKALDFTLAYSRRINRPSFWALNPFPDYSDPFSLRVGDPDIDPEIIDNIEIGFSRVTSKGFFIYAAAYARQINNPFQRFITVDSNGVSIVRYTNFGIARNLGIEAVLRGKIGKRLTLMSNLNFFRNYLDAGDLQADLDANNLGVSMRGQGNFKFWKNAELQLSFFFMSPVQYPQGFMYDFTNIDIGFRKEIFKGKGSIGVNLSDIFDTRRFRFRSEDFYFRGEVYRKPMSRVFTMQFTWKFGKQGQEVGRRRRGPSEGGEMDMGGF
jgi:iron complex outermembrane recepter protein